MKTIFGMLLVLFCCVFVFAEESYAQKGRYAETIQRKRVAIFHEEGFPTKSPRPPAWYQKTLVEASLNVTLIGVKEICNPDYLSRKNFDTLIIATGGYLPYDAQDPVGRFMKESGNVVIDGNMMTSDRRYPDDVSKELERLKADYGKGENIGRYHDFVQLQGSEGGTLFRYDKTLKRWINPIEYFSYHGQKSYDYSSIWGLLSWPNHGGPAHQYYRPFSEDLRQNPALASAGLLKDLPETLPQTVVTDDGTKVAANSSRPLGFARFQLPTRGSRSFNEYAHDLLIPVYMFNGVSGNSYSSFPNAGKDAKDKDSDFYIYRSRLRLKNGSTLVHFGTAGAHLLRSDKGKNALLATLRLAESELPGEHAPEFIEACRTLDSELSVYYGKAIQLMGLLSKVGTLYHYQAKKSEYEKTLSLLMAEQKTFEAISGEGDNIQAGAWDGVGHESRLAMIQRCRALSASKDALIAECQRALRDSCKPPAPVDVKNRFKHLAYGFSDISPDSITRMKEIYPVLKDIGFSLGPYYMPDAGGLSRADEWFHTTGIATGYRMSYPNNPHPAKSAFETAVLNPEKNTTSPAKWSWFDTPEERSFYEKDIAWFLEKTQRNKGIGYVTYLSERDMGWTLWGGKRIEERFRGYLKARYGTLEGLNTQWNTDYKSLDDIEIPLKRPITQRDHALWEDWTRYREVYYLAEEVMPEANLVKKYAPGLWSLVYGSYNEHSIHPANGVNFYEIGKVFNPSTLEMGPGTKKEILSADIVGFFNRNLTSEWSAFYFPPSAHPDKIDLLKQEIWKGVGWGQIGIHTFVGASVGAWAGGRWLTANDDVQPISWQLKEVVRDSRLFEHIVLDGEREEPPVRILYSPTTRRHTSWPSIEHDKSMDAICGHYSACQANHTPARAIDEGAVMEGHLSPQCRLLVLSDVTYLNNNLRTIVEKFVLEGGAILITPDSGRFDQHGHRVDSLLALAGVSTIDVKEPVANLGQGDILNVSAYKGKITGLTALFPEETDVILSFKSGEPAVTRTKYGKGLILVTGVPFGIAYNQEWIKTPGVALPFLKAIFSAAGVEEQFVCSDPLITVRPWRHDGRRYLILTDMGRQALVQAPKLTGGFPFARPPRMTQFPLKIRGNVLVKDYLLGMTIPSTFDGVHTTISGMISSPGGVVYELEDDGKRQVVAMERKPEPAAPAPVVADGNAKKNYSLPFDERLYFEQGAIKAGDYLISMEVDAKGGTWGGDFYLIASLRGEKIRKLCRNGDTIVFPFIGGKSLKVVCESVSAVMPVSVKAAFSEEKTATAQSGCSIKEEPFLGQKSILLENEYLSVRILPELGGRIIQFSSKPDMVNHFFCDNRLVSQGWGDNWINYGGMEENAGAWPGPFWNTKFACVITKNSPDEIRISLQRAKSAASRPGVGFLEKEYALKRGESRLTAHIKMHNDGEVKKALKLRSHPVLAVGGSVSSSDAFYYPTGHTSIEIPYMVGKSTPFIPNEGTWAALIDRERKKGIIQSFRKEDVDNLYMCMGADNYTLELTTPAKEIAPGAFLAFDYDLGVAQGISGISGFAAGLAVNIVPSNPVYARNCDVLVKVEISALTTCRMKAQASISGKGTDVRLKEFPVALEPDRPVEEALSWNTGDLADGEYMVVLKLLTEDGKELLVVRKPIELAGEKQAGMLNDAASFRAKLSELTALYNKDKGNEKYRSWRSTLARAAILLSDLDRMIAVNDTERISSLKEDVVKLFATMTK